MGQAMTQTIAAETRAEPGMHVLDVACGTGEPSITIAQLLAESGLVVGVDISSEPLKIAAQRARERGFTNVCFQQADVQALPFADGSFDRVACRLGVMFFADLSKALGEMHRVLKRGGRVTLLAWGPMEQPYFETTIGTILRVVPGAVLPDASKPMFKFGRREVLSGALQEAGFSVIKEEFPVVPWTWPGTPEEVWDYFQQVTVPFRPLLNAIPQELRSQVDAEVLRSIGRYYDGRQVNFTATVCLVSASA